MQGALANRLAAVMRDADWRSLETFAFGDSPEMADRLCALVLAGKKTATCWPARDGEKTYLGKRMVVLDGRGRPAAVIETIELSVRRFNEVDEAFAAAEGEGDRSLAHWREAHRRYFARQGTFAPDMELWCERFRVVVRLQGGRRRRNITKSLPLPGAAGREDDGGMKKAVPLFAALAFASPAFAAGIDSHAYSCADLHALIATNGFVFIGNPDFQDFVVANGSFCLGADITRPRSVATIDRRECVVNYCVDAHGAEGGARN